MAGPALAIQIFIEIAYVIFTLLLLIFAIINRRALKWSIPAALFFLLLSFLAVYAYVKMNNAEYRASQKFLGDYRLNRLDRKKCDGCFVRLYDGYTYEIFSNGKVAGHGKWHLETAIDIPGYFLKIENGPTNVVWGEERVIDYIDRSSANK